MRTAVVANDFHGIFRDKKTCKLLFDFIKRQKPDEIILAGDVIDFYSISKFLKDPRRKWDVQKEVDDAYTILVDLKRSAPRAKIHYIEGNHETRLQKFLWGKSPALTTIRNLQFEKLMELDKLKVKYHTAKKGYQFGDLFIYHGSLVRAKGGYTARGELEKNGCSGMSGHSHRDGKAPSRKRGGQLCWWENFCLCDLDAEYIDGIADWSQGWSKVTLVGKRPHVEPIFVANHSYIYGGKIWK